MSFRMGVQEDRVLPPGPYQAVLDKIEIKETINGERLMWTFGVPEENTQVVGFSSLNEKTSAKAYSWASAIAGQIEPNEGWGPETVEGKQCTIYVDTAKDAQGRLKNKVQGVAAPRDDLAKSSQDEKRGQKQGGGNGEEADELEKLPF